MKDYDVLEEVRKGIYKLKRKATGEVVEMKLVRISMEEGGIPTTVLREISILRLLSPSNYIVSLLDVEKHMMGGIPHACLIFEDVKTDLKNYINSHSIIHTGFVPLPPAIIQKFLYQLCKGVAFCHSHGVLHRNLNPTTILVDTEKGRLKISGFKCVRASSIDNKTPIWYLAPQILLGKSQVGPDVDIWAVGCIFAEMARGDTLFHGTSDLNQLFEIFSLLGTPTEEICPEISSLRDDPGFPQSGEDRADLVDVMVPVLGPQGVDLLSKMLEYDPKKRISAVEAMDHQYFDSLDKSQF